MNKIYSFGWTNFSIGERCECNIASPNEEDAIKTFNQLEDTPQYVKKFVSLHCLNDIYTKQELQRRDDFIHANSVDYV